jgi:hypothetical protein
MRYRIYLVTLALTAISSTALGQVTGELVEPDVMIVLDSSGSMDWLSDPPTEDKSHWDLAYDACVANDASKKTSWQQVLDAFLGGVPENYACSVEHSKLRPSFDGLGTDDRDELKPYFPDYVSEFRESFYPHFRAMRCDPDNWKLNDAGFYQCISDDTGIVDFLPAGDMTLQGPAPEGTVRCESGD